MVTLWSKIPKILSYFRWCEIFITIKKACPETRLYLFLRTGTFVGIQSPVPKFEGNNKENKGNQNQTTDIKEDILVLQEIAGRIVGRKGKRHDEAN